jgi:MoaA/NifB/PqqE/SkfB family radical SAM enzyme
MCGGFYFKDDKQLTKRAMAEVKTFLPDVRELFLTGHGDPFARQDTRTLLINLDKVAYPDLKINLLTNGLLLPRYWQKIKDLNFGFINISVDAATKKTYEQVRKNGTWEDLIRAFEIVQANRNKFEYALINMTVMRSNFREIPAFVELASCYGFGVGINKVRGRWKDENIFTSSEDALFEELAGLIRAAAEKAKALGVPFDYGTFVDILDGRYPTIVQRSKQNISDTLMYLFYKAKSFGHGH